jgi:hypothetical protein
MEPDKKPRRGSETRQKSKVVPFRMAETEYAELAAAAERSGQTIGSYIRAQVLKAPTTRATRRPSVEVQALARLQGEMNKVGSNIAQILKRINYADTPHGNEIREAFSGYREVIAAILKTLGREAP